MAPDWRVPFADLVMSEADIDAAVDTYRSGWLTMGARTERFESEFADFVGVRCAVAVSSGTAALHLIAIAAGIGPGDEVILPSLTFVATASAVACTGAAPVFADIASPGEPWLSARTVEERMSERTKAVVAVSYGGHPGEIRALADLCERRGLVLIEDAAHALGSRLGGRHVGSFGIAGAFSFFSNKNLPIGEAGMVVTDSEAVAERVRSLRSWGLTTRPAEPRDAEALGFNYRIDEPRAALGTSRLARLDAETAERASIVERYREALDGTGSLTAVLRPPEDAELSHHLFAILLAPGTDRDRFRAALADRGVETSVHFPPVHRFTYYRDPAVDLPATDEYSRRTVSLPLYPHLTSDQLCLVTDAVRGAT